MATSAAMNTDRDVLKYKITITQNSQNIVNNTSNVTVKVNFYRTNTGYTTYGSGTVYCKIDGTTYTAAVTPSQKVTNSGIDLFTKTLDIKHNDNGTKTLTCSAWIKHDRINSTETMNTPYSQALTTIPRAAKITAADDFNDESNPTVKYSNPAGSSVDSLKVAISTDGGKTATIPYRNVAESGTSYTFSLNDNERNALRQASKNSLELNVTYLLETKIGSVTYVEKATKKLTIVNAWPSLNNITIEDGNSYTAYLTGSTIKLIRYHSHAVVNMVPDVKKMAYVKEQSVANGDYAVNGSSHTFNNVDNHIFKFRVTDSRGCVVTQTIDKFSEGNFISYVRLTCNSVQPDLSLDGAMPINIYGRFWDGNFGQVENYLTLQYLCVDYSKPVSELVDSDWKNIDQSNITYDYNTNSYNANIYITGLDDSITYRVRVRAVDKLETTPEREFIVSSTPTYEWGQNDFQVNGILNVRRGSPSDANAIHQIGLGFKGRNDSWRMYVHPNGDFSLDSWNPDTDTWRNKVLSFGKDDVLSDFVIEQGVSDPVGDSGTVWTYKKWRSGTVEAWCYSQHKYELVDGQFSFYIPYPFPIYGSLPIIQGSRECWRCHKPIWVTNGDNDMRVFLYVDSVPDNVDESPFGIHAHVYGRWK